MTVGRLAVWPAIDLREGRVVRLLRGELPTATVYDGEPADVARRFADQGADGIHVVDLDAAFGLGENRGTIFGIVGAVSIPVQVGGGLRTAEVVRRCLEYGVGRVVVATLAFRDPDLFLSLSEEFTASRFVVALDCRDGRPTTSGWTRDAGAGDAAAAARELSRREVGALLVTDVTRDGAMEGPNLEHLASVRRVFPGELLASGGLRGEEDLAPVDAALKGGSRGAVFGRALHAGATSVARLRSALAPHGRAR